MSEEEAKQPLRIFGYPVKDWVLLLALVSGGSFAGFKVSGSQSETTQAIKSQEESVVDELRLIKNSLSLSAEKTAENAQRIDDLDEQINSRLDTLQGTVVEGLRNLDGYFRGRLDQIKDN